MNPLRIALSALFLAALAACHGGGDNSTPTPPAPANRLVYTDPTDASRWRLLRNPASTATRLQLDLVAPTGAAGRGATLVLSCGPAVAWSAVENGALVKNLAYSGDLLQRASLQGADLRLLLSQKPGAVRAYGGAAVLTVAVTLNAGAATGSVALSASQGAHLAAAAAPEALDPLIGTLQAQ